MNPTIEELAARVAQLEAAVGLGPLKDSPVELHRLLVAVCHPLGVRVSQVRSMDRKGHLIPARQIFCFLARQCRGASFRIIAASLRPEMDHSTVLHHAASCEDRMDTDAEFLRVVQGIAAKAGVELPERYRL